MADRDEKILFAVSHKDMNEGGVPVLIVGVPRTAFEKLMRDGTTPTLDLQRIGVPIQLILYAGESFEECKRVLNTAGAIDYTHGEFGIK